MKDDQKILVEVWCRGFFSRDLGPDTGDSGGGLITLMHEKESRGFGTFVHLISVTRLSRENTGITRHSRNSFPWTKISRNTGVVDSITSTMY